MDDHRAGRPGASSRAHVEKLRGLLDQLPPPDGGVVTQPGAGPGVDVAILSIIGLPHVAQQLEDVSLPLVELYQPNILIPSHHDELWVHFGAAGLRIQLDRGHVTRAELESPSQRLAGLIGAVGEGSELADALIGVASLDILGNVIPFIRNEEEKMEEETLKLLGRLNGSGVIPAGFAVLFTLAVKDWVERPFCVQIPRLPNPFAPSSNDP